MLSREWKGTRSLMMFHRPARLHSYLAVLILFALVARFPALSAAPQAQQPPAGQQPPPKPPNPFENVPVGPAQPEAPKPAPKPEVRQAQPGQPVEDVIESIEF